MADFESIGDIVSRIIPLLGEPLPDIYSEPSVEPSVRTDDRGDDATDVSWEAAA